MASARPVHVHVARQVLVVRPGPRRADHRVVNEWVVDIRDRARFGHQGHQDHQNHQGAAPSGSSGSLDSSGRWVIRVIKAQGCEDGWVVDIRERHDLKTMYVRARLAG